MNKLTNAEIRDYFDRHPNLTLAELSRMTGKTVFQLKMILLNVDLIEIK
jgi:hypothetical protein